MSSTYTSQRELFAARLLRPIVRIAAPYSGCSTEPVRIEPVEIEWKRKTARSEGQSQQAAAFLTSMEILMAMRSSLLTSRNSGRFEEQLHHQAFSDSRLAWPIVAGFSRSCGGNLPN